MRRSRWKLVGGKLTAHILEEDVVNEIGARLWLEYRIKVWRVRERLPGMGKLSEAGIPDLFGWIPGEFIRITPTAVEFTFNSARRPIPLFIECKRPGGARRAAQTRFIDDARSDGCVAFFASSWGDVVREMEGQCGIKLKGAA